jgi:hypothetical protein
MRWQPGLYCDGLGDQDLLLRQHDDLAAQQLVLASNPPDLRHLRFCFRLIIRHIWLGVIMGWPTNRISVHPSTKPPIIVVQQIINPEKGGVTLSWRGSGHHTGHYLPCDLTTYTFALSYGEMVSLAVFDIWNLETKQSYIRQTAPTGVAARIIWVYFAFSFPITSQISVHRALHLLTAAQNTLRHCQLQYY